MTASDPTAPAEPAASPAPRRRFDALRRVFEDAFDSESRSDRPLAHAPTVALKPGMTNLEFADFIRGRFYADRDWARARRRVWSARATLTRIAAFALSALATIFLGVSTLDGWGVIGFIFSALLTTASGVEAFFNWRSRWIAADAALAQWHALEENLAFYVSETAEADLDRTLLVKYDEQRREVWSSLTETWLSERRTGSTGA